MGTGHYMGYIGMSSLFERVSYFFKDILVRNSIDFGHFVPKPGLKLGMGFAL